MLPICVQYVPSQYENTSFFSHLSHNDRQTNPGGFRSHWQLHWSLADHMIGTRNLGAGMTLENLEYWWNKQPSGYANLICWPFHTHEKMGRNYEVPGHESREQRSHFRISLAYDIWTPIQLGEWGHWYLIPLSSNLLPRLENAQNPPYHHCHTHKGRTTHIHDSEGIHVWRTGSRK